MVFMSPAPLKMRVEDLPNGTSGICALLDRANHEVMMMMGLR